MTLFSLIFTGVFLAFIIAAIVGHALLLDALVRPFFGKVVLGRRSARAVNQLQTVR